MNKVALFILIVIALSNCGLFDRRYPKAGTFCNVLEKPPECIFVDFQGHRIQLNSDTIFPMQSINRVNYFFFNESGEKIEVKVLTEHRVQLTGGKFYLRRKKEIEGGRGSSENN